MELPLVDTAVRPSFAAEEHLELWHKKREKGTAEIISFRVFVWFRGYLDNIWIIIVRRNVIGIFVQDSLLLFDFKAA